MPTPNLDSRNMSEEDPWDAFGDDENDDDDGNQEEKAVLQSPTEPLALHLTQYFVTRHHRSSLGSLRVRVCKQRGNENDSGNDDDDELMSLWQAPFLQRGFQVVTQPQEKECDVLVLGCGTAEKGSESSSSLHLSTTTARTTKESSLVVPGGLVACWCQSQREITAVPQALLDADHWHVQKPEHLQLPLTRFDNNQQAACATSTWVIVTKWPVPIQSKTCPWLPSQYNVYAERQRVAEACVYLTASEREQRRRTTSSSSSSSLQNFPAASIQAAVEKLKSHGYCILPGLLDPVQCRLFGKTALEDLKKAAAILKRREGVDLLEPRNSTQEPASYRELSMREDLRMDLRHGPRLNRLRGAPHGCQPWTIRAATDLSLSSPERFLRGDPIIMEIVRKTMNPVDPALSPGNFGRHNFGGSGPDGSFVDLRVGPVGAIISLPGSADQAIHADTPHLFEIHDCLPAHYINVFTPGCAANPAVGQTALVHGSHRLSFTAQHLAQDNNASKKGWVDFLVRPSLTLGDVLLFDCRILHFGLANTSSSFVERPLLYTNCWQHWFHDPKNWDDQRPIFPAEVEGEDTKDDH